MTDEELRKLVLSALASVVPELEEATLVADKSFRDQLDIDSVDFLNYVIALHEALKIDIPEADDPQLSTLNGAVAYLGRRLKQQAPTP
ncbi:MAG TPA: acyl carrier protein [Alphaproteobacteria bacterium]|nr:acyl carrier protein [Alphaproteobacteria bacterium]